MSRPPKKKAVETAGTDTVPAAPLPPQIGRPFPPGVSGNPGGRPKAVRELLELARESVPDALRFAKELLADTKAKARVRLDAAKFLTAYGLGAAPRLPIDGDGDFGAGESPAGPLSTEDLLAIARATRPAEPGRGPTGTGNGAKH